MRMIYQHTDQLCTSQKIYKTLTPITANKVSTQLNSHKIRTEEEKGSVKNPRACKEQVIIDMVSHPGQLNKKGT